MRSEKTFWLTLVGLWIISIAIIILTGCAAPRSYYVPGPNVSHGEEVVVGTEGDKFIVAYWENDMWKFKKIKGNLK